MLLLTVASRSSSQLAAQLPAVPASRTAGREREMRVTAANWISTMQQVLATKPHAMIRASMPRTATSPGMLDSSCPYPTTISATVKASTLSSARSRRTTA